MRKRKPAVSMQHGKQSIGPSTVWIRDISMVAVSLAAAGFSEVNIVRILAAMLFLTLITLVGLGRPNS